MYGCPKHYTHINRFNQLKNAVSIGAMDKSKQNKKGNLNPEEPEKASLGVY